MLHYYSLLVIILAFAIFGCKDSVSSSGSPGNIIGYVQVYDTNYKLISNFSGVKVSLEGAPYSTLSDASGKWQLSNVPAGTYGIVFSKDGYATQKQYDFEFTGNGTYYYSIAPNSTVRAMMPFPNLYPDLVLRPFEDEVQVNYVKDSVTIDSLSAAHHHYIYDTIITKLEVAIFSSRSKYSYIGTRVVPVLVFAKDKNLDPANASTYLLASSDYSNNQDTSGAHNLTVLRSSLLNAGFHSNDSVYCCAFAGTLYSIFTWTDPLTNRDIYSGLSPYHSEVRSFLLP